MDNVATDSLMRGTETALLDEIALDDDGGLTIDEVVSVAKHGRHVSLKSPEELQLKLNSGAEFVRVAVALKQAIYGVNTNFGAMANERLSASSVAELQRNLLRGLKCGTGALLPDQVVRAAMLIRARALSQGASGVRPEIVLRLIAMLNAKITPCVRAVGSIGASGDLVPLGYIAGAVFAQDDGYAVQFRGQTVSASEALRKIGLLPLLPQAKEGLALVNGTSVMSAIASLTVHRVYQALTMALHINALLCTALTVRLDAFDAHVHSLKPHPGQKAIAAAMRSLFGGIDIGETDPPSSMLLQDRYSIRCIPQYFGPILDGINSIQKDIETEINGVDDNPIVDVVNKRFLSSGNFYGQYIALGMDRLRVYIALICKQLDVQISLLVSPEFNNGLPASLSAESSDAKFGLKGLQLCGNSILPLLVHMCNPITPLFPTHAEQFNQNINSQGYNSAMLAWEGSDMLLHYLAIASIFAIQGVQLRAQVDSIKKPASDGMSPHLKRLYDAICRVLERDGRDDRPLITDDRSFSIEDLVDRLYYDLRDGGTILEVSSELTLHCAKT